MSAVQRPESPSLFPENFFSSSYDNDAFTQAFEISLKTGQPTVDLNSLAMQAERSVVDEQINKAPANTPTEIIEAVINCASKEVRHRFHADSNSNAVFTSDLEQALIPFPLPGCPGVELRVERGARTIALVVKQEEKEKKFSFDRDVGVQDPPSANTAITQVVDAIQALSQAPNNGYDKLIKMLKDCEKGLQSPLDPNEPDEMVQTVSPGIKQVARLIDASSQIPNDSSVELIKRLDHYQKELRPENSFSALLNLLEEKKAAKRLLNEDLVKYAQDQDKAKFCGALIPHTDLSAWATAMAVGHADCYKAIYDALPREYAREAVNKALQEKRSSGQNVDYLASLASPNGLPTTGRLALNWIPEQESKEH